MTPQAIQLAARMLWKLWENTGRIPALPEECRPLERSEGYAIQAALADESGQAVIGWKIAATTESGQRHINVNGPIAGRLLQNKVLPPGASIPLGDNHMRVAEAELVFRFGRNLPAKKSPYGLDEVMAAVDAVLPGIEVPDSRYENFCVVGDAQLIAENACAAWFILGTEPSVNWRELDLVSHPVRAYRNGVLAGEGTGAMVLGDPKTALVWIANELSALGLGLRSGDIVTTGTVVTPVRVEPGDAIHCDFGVLGTLGARIV
ncbi:MAG: fumarylacetoacetate hydrolase family protein [Betaproteobacteria bacterium]|nr:fumarylacetoacetate hydrolase family protein [Betaproteobacteria bacterium]MDE2621925.1 fumarylacetoacetate hydrolase family protein [Betaproteobacteria bacterium]